MDGKGVVKVEDFSSSYGKEVACFRAIQKIKRLIGTGLSN
jgi:hypothetical protein